MHAAAISELNDGFRPWWGDPGHAVNLWVYTDAIMQQFPYRKITIGSNGEKRWAEYVLCTYVYMDCECIRADIIWDLLLTYIYWIKYSFFMHNLLTECVELNHVTWNNQCIRCTTSERCPVKKIGLFNNFFFWRVVIFTKKNFRSFKKLVCMSHMIQMVHVSPLTFYTVFSWCNESDASIWLKKVRKIRSKTSPCLVTQTQIEL